MGKEIALLRSERLSTKWKPYFRGKKAMREVFVQVIIDAVLGGGLAAAKAKARPSRTHT